MEHYLVRFVAAFILVSLLAGCVAIGTPSASPASPTSPPPPTPLPPSPTPLPPSPTPLPSPTPNEPVTIKLMSWFPGLPVGKGEEALIEQFTQSHAGLTIDRGQMTTWEPYPYIRGESSAGDTPADLVTNAPDIFMLKSVERDELVDMSELWQQTGLVESLPAAMQTFAAVNGKQYYMPYGLSWAAVYYNKAVFEQYGLTPPTTWDEFLAICETLKQKDEIALAIPGQHWFPDSLWFDYLDIRINGAEFHRQLQNGEIPFTDERVRTVLETWQKLFLDGFVHPKSANMGSPQALGSLVRSNDFALEPQKAAMMLARSDQLLGLPQKYHSELGFFAFPIIDPSVPRGEVIHILSYLLPKKAEYSEAALGYAESIVSLESQQALVEAGIGLILVHPGIDLTALESDMQQGRALLDQAEDFSVVFFLMPESMYYSANSAVNSFIQNPEKLDELIKRLEEARQQALKNGDFVHQTN